MNEIDPISLSRELQMAFDSRDLEKVISFYHEDIVLISPSYPKPIVGIDSLRQAVARQFDGPQRTKVTLNEMKTFRISENVELLVCEATGYQTIYYSTYNFKGMFSRIFIKTEQGPKIIAEHFSILNE